MRAALSELSRVALPGGEGIVRLQLSGDGSGGCHLIGGPRGLGAAPPEWRAVTAPLTHPGPLLAGGHKGTQGRDIRTALRLARDL